MYFGACVKMKDHEDTKKNEAGLCVMIRHFNNTLLNMVKSRLQKCVQFYSIFVKKYTNIYTFPFTGQTKQLEKYTKLWKSLPLKTSNFTDFRCVWIYGHVLSS